MSDLSTSFQKLAVDDTNISQEEKPLAEFWNDECIISSHRGSLHPAPISSKSPNLFPCPPDIVYGKTSDQTQFPSLTITGGCCETCEHFLKTAVVRPPKQTQLHKWAYYYKLEESTSKNCSVCKIIQQIVITYSTDLPNMEKWNPDICGSPTFTETSTNEDSIVGLDAIVLQYTPDPPLRLNKFVSNR